MSRRVVITGMGAVTPLGTGVEKFWEGIKENKIGYSFIDKFDTERIGVKIAGIVRDFDEASYYEVPGCFDKKESRRMDVFTKYAVAAAHEALVDAGSDFSDIDAYRKGVIVGSGIGGVDLTLSEHCKYLEKGPSRISAFYIPMMISNMAAGTISMKTGFRGDNFDITTACASSTHSIGEAFRKIKDGYLDVAVAGGTESTSSEFTYGGFANMKALTKCDDLQKASIPFDKERSEYLEKGPSRISAFYIPMMISNMAAGTISMKTGFRGDNFDITTACASSTHSIGEAFRKIKDGYLDVAVAGGTESTSSEFTYGGFANMKALTKCDDLQKASIPFDKERSGFVLGEGSGILVLEEYEHAKARGAKIYAEIAGYGATCDGYHMTSPMPSGEAAGKGMALAVEEAGLRPEDIDYINAHGTSTGLNDKYETAAIKLALGEHAYKVKINSTKSMIGHLLGAAGAVEAIVCAKSIQEGLIHATVGYKTPDEECDLDYCGSGNVEQTVNAALSNSLGFGGHNATLCFKRVTD